MEALLAAKVLAAKLGVKQSTIYQWAQERKIPHVVLNVGKRKTTIRFRESQIEAMLADRERKMSTTLRHFLE